VPKEVIMAISNVNAQPSVNTPIGNASAPFAHDAKPVANPDVATVVNLSAQGQQLSQQAGRTNSGSQGPANSNPVNQNQANQNGAANNANAPQAVNVGPQSTATVAPPGIQLVSGDSKGGRVNTYA
jgi:hypothetical protein